MKYEVLLVGFLLFGLKGAGQSVDWEKATDWTFYAVHGKDMWQLSVDSLDQFPHVALSGDSARYLLTDVTMLDDKKVQVWMGGFVLSCRLDRQKRKLLVSSYNGFFYDGGSKHWYRVTPDRQQEWQDYLTNRAVAADNK